MISSDLTNQNMGPGNLGGCKPLFCVEEVEKLVLSYFNSETFDYARVEDLKTYLAEQGVEDISKQDITNIIKDLGIFKRIGSLKGGQKIIKVDISKINSICDEIGLKKVDKYGNVEIPGLKLDGYNKFGIGIDKNLKSTDPYKAVHWRTREGYMFNPYTDKIEISQIEDGTLKKSSSLSVGASAYTRKWDMYVSIIWDFMYGNGNNHELGSSATLNLSRGDKSFHNKVGYISEIERVINELEEVGWHVLEYQKIEAVKLLARHTMKEFQGIKNLKKCGTLKKKFYSPIINASFVLYILECDGLKIPNTRQCKFLRAIGWNKCRYGRIKEILEGG